jgi:hypothetical protein
VCAALLIAFYAILSFERLEIFKMLLSSFFPLAVLILSVLGTIVFGLATPTEAAAVGAFGGALLAAAYGRLNFGVVKESVFLTAKTSAMVCWLFVGSAIFSAAFALLGGQELVEKFVLDMDLTPIQFMILAQCIIFILGWPLEWTEIIVIFMPIFIPLLAHFNIDPLFFGLLVAINLQTAFLSPPVAMSAFYLKGVAPSHVTLNQIFAGMLPFMGIQIVMLILLYMFPGIGMWLPAELAQMKPTAHLINVARGGIVDDAALISALRQRRLSGAALDVFEGEPKLNPGFLELDNVTLTPHIGSSSRATRMAMAMTAANNLIAALSGRRPPNLLNPEAWK